MQDQNIGNWTAKIKNEGKTPSLIVEGTFPTNGERPLFKLEKSDPQGIIKGELLLTLLFGELADSQGEFSATVSYPEVVVNEDQYQTVLIVDPNNRKIAKIKVTK